MWRGHSTVIHAPLFSQKGVGNGLRYNQATLKCFDGQGSRLGAIIINVILLPVVAGHDKSLRYSNSANPPCSY